MSTWSKKTVPAAGSGSARPPDTTTSVPESRPSDSDRSARVSGRIGRPCRHAPHAHLGEARHRVHRTGPDELGPDPDAARRHAPHGLGGPADDVCHGECGPLRRLAHAAAPPQTAARRCARDGQSDRPSRSARGAGVPSAGRSAIVSAALFARPEPDRAWVGAAETTGSETRAAYRRPPATRRPPRSISNYAPALPPVVCACWLRQGSTQVIRGIRARSLRTKSRAATFPRNEETL